MFEKILQSIVALLIGFFTYSQSKIDVLHYRFEIDLNDKNDTIYGKAEITFEKFRNERNIKLDLANPNAKGKGMFLDSIKWGKLKIPVLDKNVILSDAEYCRFDNDVVKIYLGSGISKYKTESLKDTSKIIIYYHGVPSDGLIISENKFGKRTFFADNWPNRAHNWIPCVDEPADKASVEFIVIAPEHYKVVSNGIMLEEKVISQNKKRTHYKEEVPLPTKVMVIGVADFAVEKAGEVSGVPVYSWVFTENKDKGFYDYAQAVEILSFFTDYIGPFPYKKLANVQSKTIFGGMENAGAIFYHENSVTGERAEEGLLAHEIAHQWFGDMATEKSFPHLWLSEGFATYLTHVYMEQKYGMEKLEKGMAEDRNQVIDFAKTKQLPVVDSVSSLMSLLNANSYQKGSWILHMLRRQLGDSVFHQVIRTYYETYKGKNADTKDFQQVAEKISGKNLEKFFNQWLYKPGTPELDMNWKYNDSNKKIYFTITQTQKGALFEFPLEILIQQNPGSEPKKFILPIHKKTESFDFSIPSKPVIVIADPRTSLLFEGRLKEVKN